MSIYIQHSIPSKNDPKRMNQDHIQVWANCLRFIREQVNGQSFKTWFEPIQPMRLEGQILTIQVPNKFFYEWLEEHFIGVLKQALNAELGKGAQLEYLIPRSNTRPIQPVVPPQGQGQSPVTLSKDLEKNYGQMPIRADKIKNPFVIPGIQKIKVESQLNPDYTFDSFVEGDCNRLARSAGMAVAKRPGQTAFNPLMIFGSVGLGKTHLAHAIGNEAKRLFPDRTALYVSSERFTNQFIDALKNNAVSDFINFYQLIDILILDDIQFLENKQKTQDIFFHIFNHLHQGGKQIILTSDRPPKELEGIEERLISRFKWGLSADLQIPTHETRMAIVLQKMQSDGVEIPNNVAEFISYNVRSNVRELEGILISLIAQAALNQRDIDIELAKQVIGNVIEDKAPTISVGLIQRIVAQHYNITVDQLKEKSRKHYIVLARQLAMHLTKQMTAMSLKNIGKEFGGRDHTTVMHACSSIEEMLQESEPFREIVESIERKIRLKGV